MTRPILFAASLLAILSLSVPGQASLFGAETLNPVFCKLPVVRRTVVYIDDTMMVAGETGWARRLAEKLEATLAPGEPVSVVRLSPASGQSTEIWSGCWPAFTAAERAKIAGKTWFFSESPLASLATQRKLFLHDLSDALGRIYLASRRPAGAVRIDPAHPPAKNIIRALASDESRFSESTLTTRAILYSDLAEQSDLGSVFASKPSTLPDDGEKLGTWFRRSVFYAYGVGSDVTGDPAFIEEARRFWGAVFASMDAAVGGIGADLNLPNRVPVAARLYRADLAMDGQHVDGVLSLLLDADGDLVDSWLGFNRLSISTIRGTFRCAAPVGKAASCRLSATTTRGIATESPAESLQLTGSEPESLSGRLGVAGALTFPLSATALTD